MTWILHLPTPRWVCYHTPPRITCRLDVGWTQTYTRICAQTRTLRLRYTYHAPPTPCTTRLDNTPLRLTAPPCPLPRAAPRAPRLAHLPLAPLRCRLLRFALARLPPDAVDAATTPRFLLTHPAHTAAPLRFTTSPRRLDFPRTPACNAVLCCLRMPVPAACLLHRTLMYTPPRTAHRARSWDWMITAAAHTPAATVLPAWTDPPAVHPHRHASLTPACHTAVTTACTTPTHSYVVLPALPPHPCLPHTCTGGFLHCTGAPPADVSSAASIAQL